MLQLPWPLSGFQHGPIPWSMARLTCDYTQWTPISIAAHGMQVQELAAATLSGFLKGLPAPAEAALRDSCLADLQRLFPTGRATKATPGMSLHAQCSRSQIAASEQAHARAAHLLVCA